MKRDAPALALLSLAALCAAWLYGVRFLSADFDTAWHLLDPELLRHELLKSLWYLHSQPPLLNLVVGVALKIGHAPLLMTALWSACAIAAALCTRELSLALGASRFLALAAGAVVALAPSTILYVHHVGPEMATAAALVASALLISREKLWGGFALLGVACLLRSLLAPPVVLIALLVVGKRAWKPALAVFTVLILLSAKNAAISGVFSTSSWMGMNLARVALVRLPPAQRPQLPYPFSEAIATPGSTGVRALDEVRKPSGAINYNNLAYAEASRAMLGADLRAMWGHPGVTLRAWALAWVLFLRPADEWPFLLPNRVLIARWSRFWDQVLCAEAPLPAPLFGLTEIFFTLLLAVVLLAAAARDRRSWYALALIASVAVFGNTFDVGENYRFRFLVGPLWAAVAAAALPKRT